MQASAHLARTSARKVQALGIAEDYTVATASRPAHDDGEPAPQWEEQRTQSLDGDGVSFVSFPRTHPK